MAFQSFTAPATTTTAASFHDYIISTMIRNRSSSTLSTNPLDLEANSVNQTQTMDSTQDSDVLANTTEVMIDMSENMMVDVSTASHFDKSQCETVSTHRLSPTRLGTVSEGGPNYLLRVMLCFVVFVVLGLAIALTTVYVGARFEGDNVRKAASITSEAAADDDEQVCATSNINANMPSFTTFEDFATAKAAGLRIAHCGSCGACSRPSDISALSADTNKLDFVISSCGRKAIKKNVGNCLDHHLGLSQECHNCWHDYTTCSAKQCKFTCLKLGNGNQCAECRDVLCGDSLATCSGATRKTLGFLDYETNDVCQVVDLRWDL